MIYGLLTKHGSRGEKRVGQVIKGSQAQRTTETGMKGMNNNRQET